MAHSVLDQESLDATQQFYRSVVSVLAEAGIPYLVGGAYAFQHYTGIAKVTKDFDIFVHPRDLDRLQATLGAAGFRVERTFPHWLGKVRSGDDFMDFIFNSASGIARVDDEWFEHAFRAEVLGLSLPVCPPEEGIWSKAFIMERERYDGADIAHILLGRAATLHWERLLRRFGPHWRVLLSHLVLFGFIYPSERGRIPDWVIRSLMAQLEEETSGAAPRERVCQGTLLSWAQYLVDVEEWGYADARLPPHGRLTPEQVDHWTRAEKG
ncbi:MAG TPA: hypothetical protein VNK43_13310 [Gemmatimonadales bacterium]|nr:hypothetical protein [Gemmatimonadales bacterium]